MTHVERAEEAAVAAPTVTARQPVGGASVAAVVAEVLGHHVQHVFGVMGNGNAHLLDAIVRQGAVPYTALRHEAGAVAAADAYHRASGRLAAATTTYGAGFTNALTALAESVQASIPLILTTGDQPSSGPRPWDVDQAALASAVGVRTYTVDGRNPASVVEDAVEHALAHRVPVVLAIPYDLTMQDALTPVGERRAHMPPALQPDPAARAVLKEAARSLAAAERPLLLAGRGAWLADAGRPLGALASAAGAVTASTALGRGIFPEGRYDLGVAGGFGAQGAMELVREADLAIVFGASLNQFTMRFGELFAPGTRVIQVDSAPAPTHPRVDAYARCDAAVAASLLSDELAAYPARSAPWRASLNFHDLRRQPEGDLLAPDGRLDPRSCAARIAELLPADRIVVSDGGHFIGWANMYWSVQSPDRMHMVGTAYQTIGLGFPSMVGAARARPDSTVVLTTGDGGGLMALADLESAARTAGGRGLAVIWNDAAYGAEVNLYGLKGLAQEPMLIPEVDFAALAPGVGAEGIAIRTLEDLDGLGRWVEKPAAERRFLLLDLRISGQVIAPYQEEIIQINGGRAAYPTG